MNWEFPDIQARFRKGRGTRDQIANIFWIIERAREFQRNIYLCFLEYTKDFDCMGHNSWKILKETTLQISWETCMQVKKGQLELDMEQLTGFRIGKGEGQGYMLSPCLFNVYAEYIMQKPGWMKQKLETLSLGVTSTTSGMC